MSFVEEGVHKVCFGHTWGFGLFKGKSIIRVSSC